MATPVQSPKPLESSGTRTSYSTTTTDGSVFTGGFATAPTAGNTVIVVNFFEDAVTRPINACTITDGASNSYTLAASYADGVETRIDVWYRGVATSGQAGAQNVTIGVPAIDQANFCESSTQLIELPGLWTPRTGPGSGYVTTPTTLTYTGGTWNVGDWLLAIGVLQFSGVGPKTCSSSFSGPETVSTIYQENVNTSVMSTAYQYVSAAAYSGGQTVTVTGNTGTDQASTTGLTVAFYAGNGSVDIGGGHSLRTFR